MKSIETILFFIFRAVFAEERFVIGVRGRAKSFVRFPACPETEHDGAKRMQSFPPPLFIPSGGGFPQTLRTIMLRTDCIDFTLRESLMAGVAFAIFLAETVRADFQRTSFDGKVLNLVFGHQFFAGITKFAMKSRTSLAINMSVPMTGGFRRLPFPAVIAENVFPV